ncbi:hypothetical protein SpCBS45565_g03202 [Spizellomyces sp. 'palustris']|nr:hypothetical protein SpCBS45565_g03202 [Spizellomyces sp. 'palustris']
MANAMAPLSPPSPQSFTTTSPRSRLRNHSNLKISLPCSLAGHQTDLNTPSYTTPSPTPTPSSAQSHLALGSITPPIEATDNGFEVELYHQGPALILPGLYLGSHYTSQSQSTLAHLGIQAVLNVAEELAPQILPPSTPSTTVTIYPPSPSTPTESTYLHLPLSHIPDTLAPHIPTAIKFINQAITQGHPVLVHCSQGVSRSAAIVIAYVMWERGWNVRDAYVWVKERANGICPSVGFVGVLVEWERSGMAI